MVFVDTNYYFNSIVAMANPTDFSNREEYIEYTMTSLLESIAKMANRYSHEYGDVVFAIDDHTKNYWRKKIYPLYKYNRLKVFCGRSFSNDIGLDVKEKWLSILKELKSSKFKIIEVLGCEADDIIAVLSKHVLEENLILSPDKDMIQLISDNTSLYDSKKEISYNRNSIGSRIDLNDHIISGDLSDNIPSIYSYLEPSEDFIKWFKDRYKVRSFTQNDYEFLMVNYPHINTLFKSDLVEEYFSNLDFYERHGAIDRYFSDILEREINPYKLPIAYKIKRKLKKDIEGLTDIEKYFEKDRLLRYNYMRNKKLIDMSLIPPEIVKSIIDEYEGYIKENKSLNDLMRRYNLTPSDLK